MLAIVVSRADEASVHIGDRLRDVGDWRETTDDSRPDGEGGGTVYRTDGAVLREFDGLHLELTGVAHAFDDANLVVFASRHAGETDELLTAHHTGNFGVAEYGGESGRFARAAPNAQSAAVAALTDHAPEGYEVGMECTHHGPTDVGAPSLFVEIGSAEPQWRDADAAHAVARAILDLRGVAADAPTENGTRRHLVGVGGGHYTPRFERVVRETDWAVGHVGADWSLSVLEELHDDDVDRETVIQRAFTASAAEYALLANGHEELATTIEGLGYRVVEETFVRETTGVSLAFVERAEAAVGTVDSGLRFGDPATGGVGEWRVFALPDELLAAATGIDADAVRAWFESETLAFGTEQNGTVVTGPVVLPAATAPDRVVEALADVLAQRYDSVDRDGSVLHARKARFDPARASALDVPEGPKFGRLSAGEAVEVDGDRIDPEAVHTERKRTFRLEISPGAMSDRRQTEGEN